MGDVDGKAIVEPGFEDECWARKRKAQSGSTAEGTGGGTGGRARSVAGLTMAEEPLAFPQEIEAGLRRLAESITGAGALPSPDVLAALDRSAADAIDLDTESRQGAGLDTSLDRVLDALQALGLAEVDLVNLLPETVEAAILAELSALDDATALPRALELARTHPTLRDEILATSLGLGIAAAADADSDPTIAPGTILFGRWRVERLLGEGRTSSVAIAVDEVLSSATKVVRVVLKRYDDAVGSSREHALREVRALASLPRDLVPQPVALHAPKGREAILVMLHEESQPPRCADDIAAAASALDRVHANGLAHGDLKPEHIRVRPDGSAFLIDFGLAGEASAEARASDLTRLIAVARPHAPRIALRAAEAAVARGHHRLASSSLQVLAPRSIRRGLRRVAIIAAIMGGTAVSGYAYGRWIAAPTMPTPAIGTTPLKASGDTLAALAESGRLIRAVVRADGRIEQLQVEWPELRLLPHPAGATRRPLKYFQFRRDGSVGFEFADSAPNQSPAVGTGQ